MPRMGRPKSKNPRSFTVPEVRLKKGEMQMFQIKAGFTGGSTAALIRKAVAAYQPELQENHCCGEKMKVIRSTDVFTHTYGDQECKIYVHNIPMWKCVKCEGIEDGLSLMAGIEEAVELEFESLLKSGATIPDEINRDFNELIEDKEPETVK